MALLFAFAFAPYHAASVHFPVDPVQTVEQDGYGGGFDSTLANLHCTNQTSCATVGILPAAPADMVESPSVPDDRPADRLTGWVVAGPDHPPKPPALS